MSRRTVMLPKSAGGKRTGLLKVYNAASVTGIDTVLVGRAVTVVATACVQTVEVDYYCLTVILEEDAWFARNSTRDLQH